MFQCAGGNGETDGVCRSSVFFAVKCKEQSGAERIPAAETVNDVFNLIRCVIAVAVKRGEGLTAAESGGALAGRRMLWERILLG